MNLNPSLIYLMFVLFRINPSHQNTSAGLYLILINLIVEVKVYTGSFFKS